MANTYELIASNTVASGGAASVTFSSIANTWTDLVVKFSARTNNGTAGVWDNISATINSSSSGYSFLMAYTADSTTPTSAKTTGSNFGYLYAPRSAATANTFGSGEFYIPNYAGSNYKSISTDLVVENNGTANFMDLWAGLWSNTAAITSISIDAGGNNFVQYSSFYLYGIKNS